MYESHSSFSWELSVALIAPFRRHGTSIANSQAVVTKPIQMANLSLFRRNLRIRFVPLTDCAPIVMASELGLFGKYGLHVELSRELGWASVRDKIIYGNLDASHAVAGMPVAATLGLGAVRCDCLTALVLNLHGNAITLSNELWQRGVRDGATLRELVVGRGGRKLVFGVVFPFASHNFLLRKWLADAGIRPDRDVQIVVVPPPQMAANLKAGNLDGFCAGEPWNSVAVQMRAGWCVATSADLAPGHPEKVLMVRSDFAEKRAEEHLALVAALTEACEFCAIAENHDRILKTLSRLEYVNVAEDVLRRAFVGPFDFGQGRSRFVQDFTVFSGRDANDPSGDKAAWVLQNVRTSGLCPEPSALNFAFGRRVFRSDLFEAAMRLRNSTPEENHETNSEIQPAIA
jgi:ABC-type nitrate/sulfonate/bicarbonate transport system substrate-binding protein